MKIDWKRCLPDLACVVLFAVIAVAYFYPADFDGRRLTGHDHNANDGISVEIKAYRDAHGGETPRWVSSVFGGMPTYQIAPSYNSTKTMTAIENAYHLWLPDYVWYIFASMLGFYILLRAFDFRQWMAALGAIVWAFSSYFFIIIAAGHIWKVMTLAYIPPAIAGFWLCYKTSKREGDGAEAGAKTNYIIGGVLLALFGALQIQANHVQMTYYFLIPEVFMFIAILIDAIRNHQMSHFVKATGVAVVAVVVAVCLNASNLYHTYEYQKETMRGKSELVKKGNEANQTDSGLERNYITAWSYGIGETWTLLVPNVNGGASVPLSMNKTAMKAADSQLAQAGVYNAFTQYWGEQPGTSGPVYIGAIVCMLFVLGLIIIPNKNPLKWALLAATILSILLAWGRNFMPFTDFFIDHVPMYAKFRTVSSILVVAEFTMPLLALLALKQFAEKPNLKALYISVGITVVACLYFAILPGECISSGDHEAISHYVSQGTFDSYFGQQILASISAMRAAMLSADAWRSMLFICLGAVVLFWYANASKKFESTLAPTQATILSVALLVLCTLDMWQVNKRYLYDDMFTYPEGNIADMQAGPAESYILEKSGNARDYRVLNFTVSTFNDNTTAAFFNSVGGYHAAKLRRYQELIEEHIQTEMQQVYSVLRNAPVDTIAMAEQQTQYPIYDFSAVNTDSVFPVLNMLNTRWFILGTSGPEGQMIKFPVENTDANGVGWFVEDVKYVANANEEIALLHDVNPKHTAVVAKEDFGFLKTVSGVKGTVRQMAHEANSVTYEVNSDKGGLVVFSEVYYPGWTVEIDGQSAELGRANYILRALNVPAGKHTVRMTFNPESVQQTETVAYIALALLILAAIAAAFMAWKNKAK